MLDTLGLIGLHTVARCRRDAFYNRSEPLNEFCIFGRWWTDTCGNWGKAHLSINQPFMPKDRYPEIPKVLTKDEFWQFLRENVTDPKDLSLSVSMGGDWIAPLGIPCAFCGQAWSLVNSHDCIARPTTKVEWLGPFVGKSFGEFQESLKQRGGVSASVQPEAEIRNDRAIDRTPLPEYEYLVVNKYGWLPKGQVTDEYVIQPGDESMVNTVQFYHTGCQQKQLAKEMEQSFRDIFANAGFIPESLEMMELPNEYGSASYNGPWYTVNTPVGRFKIGWRKRVIYIDWSLIDADLLHLFSDQDVTKGSRFIHAWSEEDAAEYLVRIRHELQGKQAATLPN